MTLEEMAKIYNAEFAKARRQLRNMTLPERSQACKRYGMTREPDLAGAMAREAMLKS